MIPKNNTHNTPIGAGLIPHLWGDPTTISPNHFKGSPFFGFFLHRKQTRRVFLIQIKQKLHAIGIGGERLGAIGQIYGFV